MKWLLEEYPPKGPKGPLHFFGTSQAPHCAGTAQESGRLPGEFGGTGPDGRCQVERLGWDFTRGFHQDSTMALTIIWWDDMGCEATKSSYLTILTMAFFSNLQDFHHNLTIIWPSGVWCGFNHLTFNIWEYNWYLTKLMGMNIQETGERLKMILTLWWTNILPWKITIFNGKIHYFYDHFQLLC